MLHGRRVALPIRLLVRTWPSVWKEKPKGAAGPDLDVTHQTKKHRLIFDAWELRDDFLRIRNDQQLLAFLNRTGKFLAGPDYRGKWFYWECQKLIAEMLTSRQEYWKKLRTKYRSDVAEWANPETREGLIADLKFRIESDLPITEILVVGTLRGMIASVHIDHLRQIRFGICQRPDCAKPFPIKSAHGQKWCDPSCGRLELLRRKRRQERAKKER